MTAASVLEKRFVLKLFKDLTKGFGARINQRLEERLNVSV